MVLSKYMSTFEKYTSLHDKTLFFLKVDFSRIQENFSSSSFHKFQGHLQLHHSAHRYSNSYEVMVIFELYESDVFDHYICGNAMLYLIWVTKARHGLI